jgi:hypothetical protein
MSTSEGASRAFAREEMKTENDVQSGAALFTVFVKGAVFSSVRDPSQTKGSSIEMD